MNMPVAGGPYAFARRALGPWGGYITGLAVTLEYEVAPAVIAVGIGGYVAGLFPAPLPWIETWVPVMAYVIFVGINLLGATWGFFAFPMYAIAVAHANDYADADDYVMVSSGLLLMYGAGAIIGPFFASAVITITGASGLYLMTMLVHASLAAYVLLRIFRRTSAPSEQHIAFSDALATAHTASQIYEEEIQYQSEDSESNDNE